MNDFTPIEKRAIIDAFKRIKNSHAWSKDESGQLSCIRAAYEAQDRVRFTRLFSHLDDELIAKRETLTELYQSLFPEEFS